MTSPNSPNTAVATIEPPAMPYALRSPLAAVLTSEEALAVIRPLIPHGLDYNVVISEVYRAGVKDPKILRCTPASIIDAVSTVVQTGLVVGKTIYLVPTGVNVAPKGQPKKYEDRLQAWNDYKGDIELVVRSGAARHVDGQAVYDGDVFELTLGTNPDVKHIPTLDPAKRGKLRGAYSVAYLNGTGTLRKVTWMPLADIEKVRKNSKSWSPESYPECPDWYAIKTVIHKNCKTLPKNEKLARVIALFDRQDAMDHGDEDFDHLPSGLDPSRQISAPASSPATATTTAEAADDADDLPFSDSPKAPTPEREHVPLDCELYPIPEGLGPKSGKPLGSLSQTDLDQLYRWAGKQAAMIKFPGLKAQCEELLEARRLCDAPTPAEGAAA